MRTRTEEEAQEEYIRYLKNQRTALECELREYDAIIKEAEGKVPLSEEEAGLSVAYRARIARRIEWSMHAAEARAARWAI